MIRLILLILTLFSLLSAEVIDRAGELKNANSSYLNSVTESILKQSGIKIIIIFLDKNEDIARLSSSFAIELSYGEEGDWVMGVISPEGSVRISTSEAISGWFSEAHYKSFISGTQREVTSQGLAVAGEFFLLNIADVIAQKKGIDFNQLFSEIEEEPIHDLPLLLMLIPLLILVISITLIKKRVIGLSKEKNPESPFFGGSYLHNNQMLFGTSVKHGEKR